MSLLELPDLVIRETLLPYLDASTKLSLRLTCRETCDWVTTPAFLTLFKIPIASESDLDHWISRYEDDENPLSEGWSSFSFQKPLKDFTRLLPLFLTLFKERVGKVKLPYAEISDPQFWTVLRNMPNLKSLTVKELSLAGQIPLPSEEGQGQRLALKKLSVTTASFKDPVDLRKWERTFDLLGGGDAEMARIPKLLYKSSDITVTWTGIKAMQWVHIAEPMIHSLLQNNNNCQKRKVTLNVKHLVPIHFCRLVEQCMSHDVGAEVFFRGVHHNHVKYVFLMSGDEHEDDFLSRIVTIREKIDDRRALRKWVGLEEAFIRTSRCDVRNYYDDGGNADQDIIFPNLKKLWIEFDSNSKDDPGFIALNRVVSLLLNVERKRLESLTLKWPRGGHNTPTNIIDLAVVKKNFQFLNKLVIIEGGEQYCVEAKKCNN